MSRVSMILNMISLQKKLLVKAAQMSVRNISLSNALRKNYYEVLGLPRDATQADIKKAYFELSKLYHPDRIAATDENLAKFREVSAAYEILGNEQSRQLYDRGILGEFKTGVDETEEIIDPIVKFYKQRQEVSKFQAYEESEAWVQTYFREAKKRASKRHELYKQSVESARDDDLGDPKNFIFSIGAVLLLAFFTAASYPDTLPDEMFKGIASFFQQ